VIVTVATEVKEGLYHDYYLANVFLPFTIKVFGCFHLQFDTFFHRCANMAWTTKGTKNLHLLMLRSFYKQRM
jgi:hypothetical protein